MGFDSGLVSFRRFAVVGEQKSAIDQEMIDALAAHALKDREIGLPEEEEYGWSGGRHILDGTFSFENNVYADALVFALRVDTNKVPGDLKQAYTIMEEEAVAVGNPSGFISKLQKKDVKDVVRRKMDDELRSGRFRRSKLTAILWDVPGGTLLAPASAKTQEKLLEIFERTFGLTLAPLSAGSQALRVMERIGKRRDYEDARPTRFAYGPDGESQMPEYPWVAKGPEAKDFLGNEFATWLWHTADAGNGAIDTELGDVTILFDRSLELDCAYGQSGKDTLRGTGPSRMPEAMDALVTGKVPRRMGLVMDAQGQQFLFNLNAETLAVSGLKLPEVEEAETPRVLFEERVAMVRDFNKAIDALFAAFLKTRFSGWEGQVSNVRRWITKSSRRPELAVA